MIPEDSNPKTPTPEPGNVFEATVFGEQATPSSGAMSRQAGKRWFPVLIPLQGGETIQRFVLKKEVNQIGRDPKTDITFIRDPRISRNHASLIWENSSNPSEYPRCYLRDEESRNGTYLNHRRIVRPEYLSDGDQIAVGATVFGYYIKDEHELAFDNGLVTMATVDGLTGLVNRRAFLEEASRTIAQALRYQHPLCLTLTDVDHFKEINDTLGHGTGDAVLRYLSRIMKESLRDGDLVGRMGGDEFAFLMPRTHMKEATLAVERVRTHIKGQPLIVNDKKIDLTLSVGIAEISDEINRWSALYNAADSALYQAKKMGRNRVCICRPEA